LVGWSGNFPEMTTPEAISGWLNGQTSAPIQSFAGWKRGVATTGTEKVAP